MTEDNTPQDQNSEELVALQEELAAMTETAKRTMADLQNFKRRAETERGEIQVYANMKLLQAIFPALDDFKRAFDNMPEELNDNEWVKGIKGVEANLMTALEGLGLEAIEEVNVPMDPHRHEVLMEGPGEKGQVTQVFEKGYAFKGNTIKPARVQVGQG